MLRSQTTSPAPWGLTVLALLFVGLFVRLGFWQLDRAEEKQSLQQQIDAQQHVIHSAQELFSKPRPSGYYRRLEVTGRFLSEPVLVLDNRIRDGRAGFEQLQLFQADDTEALMLVNRGWLASPPGDVQHERVGILAEVYPPPRPGIDLAEGQAPEQRRGYWLIQRLEVAQISQQFDVELRPELFRLLPQSAAALDVSWPANPVSANKHLGYAVQWFTMATVLGLMVAALWIRRKHERPPTGK